MGNGQLRPFFSFFIRDINCSYFYIFTNIHYLSNRNFSIKNQFLSKFFSDMLAFKLLINSF
ncbi:TPA: hypothetical protein MHT92_16720 [Klebsiella pneumoniae]|nr:hypothetical protein CWN28_20690 [Klebsiella pneumoniae]VTN19035.1 Uncharacterised protein [Klebsiella pneumoniae]HBX2592024.1 hypothetical protein [Klebsiella pneumoniae]